MFPCCNNSQVSHTIYGKYLKGSTTHSSINLTSSIIPFSCNSALHFLLEDWFFNSFIYYVERREMKLTYKRLKVCTAWKVPVFGVFWSVFSRIRTEYGEMQRYFISLCIHSEWAKRRTRKTPNTATFHVGLWLELHLLNDPSKDNIFRLKTLVNRYNSQGKLNSYRHNSQDAEFSRILFLQNTSGRLLLYIKLKKNVTNLFTLITFWLYSLLYYCSIDLFLDSDSSYNCTLNFSSGRSS